MITKKLQQKKSIRGKKDVELEKLNLAYTNFYCLIQDSVNFYKKL